MLCFTFILLFTILSTTQLFDHVLTLHVEEILRGSIAQEVRFVYHVAILVKSNGTHMRELICSGAIIAENFVLSAAQCFINKDGNLREFQYSITSNTTNWKDIGGIDALIDVIYLPSGAIHYFDDIAVAKLEKKLDLVHNPHLKALKIPTPGESFSEKSGLVTGYGFNHVIITNMYESGLQTRFDGGTDNRLRFVKVLITTNNNCSLGLQPINTDKQFCGVTKPRKQLYSVGICDNDSGSPLTVKNKIIGVAGTNRWNCDDTVVGSAYANVSYYSPFINSIINGNPLLDVLIRHNRIHSTNLLAAAA